MYRLYFFLVCYNVNPVGYGNNKQNKPVARASGLNKTAIKYDL